MERAEEQFKISVDTAEEIVKAVDLDGNGAIDYWDFLVAVTDTSRSVKDEQKRKDKFFASCRQIYDIFYKENKGNPVSNQEFIDKLCLHQAMKKRQLAQFVKEIDRDGSHAISF